jgi:hypothetical protein
MYLDNCNCTYTTSDGKHVGVSISALMKIICEIPETPKLFTMPIEIIRSDIMPKNYILLSNDVADALEKAMLAQKGASDERRSD